MVFKPRGNFPPLIKSLGESLPVSHGAYRLAVLLADAKDFDANPDHSIVKFFFSLC